MLKRVFFTDPNYRTRLFQRLWSKVRKGKVRECWEWQGLKDKDGYGRIGLVKDGKRTNVPVSRLALEAKLGRPLKRGEQACHSCDNPGCVNPRHLFLGDNKINTEDRCKKGRSARNSGEINGASKLIEEQVREIKRILLEEGWRRGVQAELAARYNVCVQTITLIKQGKRWGHL